MLSRRNFRGGIAAIASVMTTCAAPTEPLPPASDGEKLEDVLADRAIKQNRLERHAQYVMLYSSIK
jgi:hypothetical protein